MNMQGSTDHVALRFPRRSAGGAKSNTVTSETQASVQSAGREFVITWMAGIIMQHQEHHIMFMDFCEDRHSLLEDDSPTEMMMMMKKEHKDAELDKKIEALRKKNEALMKRYQEVEEDKKRAEQEGMSLHSRKGKTDDLSITINKSSNDQRVVTKRSGPGGLRDGEQEKDPGSSVFSIGRGKRRQLLVTTSGNIKGEGVRRKKGQKPSRESSEVEVLCRGRAGVQQHTRNTASSVCKESPGVFSSGPLSLICVFVQDDAEKPDQWSRCEDSYVVPVTEAVADLNLVTSKEEQLEYLRWKKEREEIDRERVARHKNAKGQWRRAWDMEKTDLMFSEKEHGGRNTRRGNMKAEESRGGQQASDRKRKCVPVVGSKAKGKDRLTGRARRWDAKEQEEHLQVYPESSLQEFLEELDALCAPEVENINPETDIENTKPRASKDSFKTTEVKPPDGTEEQNGCVSTESALKATEKKVRFSEIHDKNGTETTLQVKNSPVEDDRRTLARDHSECVPEETKPVSPEQENPVDKLNPLTEGSEELCPKAGDVRISAEPDENQPVEHSKSCSNRGNEELMDSSLSVLNLEPAESLPDHSTGADLARENGKVV
ncbi:coiled-coil domain-containing protein 9 [Cyprinus carpio]|uniref:Coiled-coil domain-containing protein 9 n=1 Tax=Cyprinus carpio TaxID=7962 RepID=A0A9Q9XBY7_CYPCA|nr:coiled-coil domain-containing protein 9 [Cyprinus carpio]